jgi:hypothetical protein
MGLAGLGDAADIDGCAASDMIGSLLLRCTALNCLLSAAILSLEQSP